MASPRANSSVWFFSTADGKPKIQDDLPLQRNDTLDADGVKHSDAIQDAIRKAVPGCNGSPS